MTKDTRNTLWLITAIQWSTLSPPALLLALIFLPILLTGSVVIFLVGWLFIKAVEITERLIRKYISDRKGKNGLQENQVRDDRPCSVDYAQRPDGKPTQ